VYTSAADAFPGDTPRPVAPELIIRSFDIPTTPATDLRLVVKSNQCSGGPAYQGEQDADPTFMTDCDTVSNVDVAKPLDDPTGTAVTWQFVRASEFQAFTTNPTVTGPAVSPPAASPPPPPPPPTNPPPPPAPKPKPKAPPRCVVPRVTGKTVAAARKAIKARRCRVGSIQSRNSRLAARGRVIAQTPRAGRRVAIGTRVSIVVSKGAVRGARVRFTG
jgi:hypothetical protein